MKQLQVTAPKKHQKKVTEVLEEHGSDVSCSDAEHDGKKVCEFKLTTESDHIDELTEELKGIDDIKSGELSIRVLRQESLIEKGQETKGSSSNLSQEEIYSRAQEFSGFDRAEWGLIGVSSAIAAYGLALNNVIVVIGAMMLAPLLSPFVSGTVSLVVGDKSLLRESFLAGVQSMLLAVAVSFTAVVFFPITHTPILQMVAQPGILTVLLSLLVGSAAALTFVTGLRDQIAGVAVAIALVPPLASVGIGLKMSDPVFAIQAASVSVINVMSIILSGFVTLKLLGLKPATYYKKKEAEEIKYVVPLAFLIIILLAVPIAYSSYQNYSGFVVEQEIQKEAEEYFGSNLLQTSFRDSRARIVVLGDYNESEFRKRLPDGVKLDLVELERTD